MADWPTTEPLQAVLSRIENLTGINLPLSLIKQDKLAIQKAESLVRHTFGSESQEWYDTYAICRLAERLLRSNNAL